jgi:hypothetical protein
MMIGMYIFVIECIVLYKQEAATAETKQQPLHQLRPLRLRRRPRPGRFVGSPDTIAQQQQQKQIPDTIKINKNPPQQFKMVGKQSNNQPSKQGDQQQQQKPSTMFGHLGQLGVPTPQQAQQARQIAQRKKRRAADIKRQAGGGLAPAGLFNSWFGL